MRERRGLNPNPLPQPTASSAESPGSDRQQAKAGTLTRTVIEELRETAVVIAVALFLVLLLRSLLFQPFTIPSASMEPTLYEGDYIIISKWNYGYSKYSVPVTLPFLKGRLFGTAPKRGEVVVFKLPGDNKKDLIKRVIGLPGDRVQMRRNQLFINDSPVPATRVGLVHANDAKFFNGTDNATEYSETLPGGRPHSVQDMVEDGPVDDTEVFVVPAHHYFMMGDNRDNSEDSRFPMSTGGVDMVPEENLEGPAKIVLLSWKQGASLWKPWTWLNVRLDRFFKRIK